MFLMLFFHASANSNQALNFGKSVPASRWKLNRYYFDVAGIDGQRRTQEL